MDVDKFHNHVLQPLGRKARHNCGENSMTSTLDTYTLEHSTADSAVAERICACDSTGFCLAVYYGRRGIFGDILLFLAGVGIDQMSGQGPIYIGPCLAHA